MRDNNVDLVVDKLIREGDKLTPARIEAFAKVINALAGQSVVKSEPNNMEDIPNAPELSEDVPLDFSEIEGVQMGSTGTKKKIKIVKPQEE